MTEDDEIRILAKVKAEYLDDLDKVACIKDYHPIPDGWTPAFWFRLVDAYRIKPGEGCVHIAKVLEELGFQHIQFKQDVVTLRCNKCKCLKEVL